MTDEPIVLPRRRGAIDMHLRLNLLNVINFEQATVLSLSGILAGLAGAAAIVYVATRHGHAPAVPAAPESEAIEATGVSLVK